MPSQWQLENRRNLPAPEGIGGVDEYDGVMMRVNHLVRAECGHGGDARPPYPADLCPAPCQHLSPKSRK